MNATDKLEQYLKIRPSGAAATEIHFMKLLLEAIREGGIKQIEIEGNIYEVYADIVETKK